MSVCAADMSKCDLKRKCISGPNEGTAYNPKDPCCGQGKFNEDICDCELNCSVRWDYVLTAQPIEIGQAGCTGNCAQTDEFAFYSGTIELPFGPVGGTPAGIFSHSSISDACDSGPVNCDRTPSSYGMSAIYFPDGTGYLGPSDPMQCGTVEQYFLGFKGCGDDDPVIGVYVGAASGGATACMASVFSLVSLVPVSDPAP